MTNINSLSWNETQILSCKSFLQMFGKNEKDIKTNYRKLLKKWHPDYSHSNTENVFIHITSLFESGNNALNSNNKIIIDGYEINASYYINDSLYEMAYDHKNKNLYIKFKQKHYELSKQFKRLSNFYKDKLTNSQFKDRYKNLIDTNILERNSLLKIKVPENHVPLYLLKEYIKDYKDYKISAYIISRLWDLAMMNNYYDIKFGGANPNFIFVNTQNHTILDYSMLFFSHYKDETLCALPSFQATSILKDDIKNKQLSYKSINSLIINASLYLAGDIDKTGNINMINKDIVHTDMIKELSTYDINKDTHELYKKWLQISVQNIFNERSFYKKEISFNDLLGYCV